MLGFLKEKVLEVIKAIMPLVVIICILQFTLVRAQYRYFYNFS